MFDGSSLLSTIDTPHCLSFTENFKTSDFMISGEWRIPNYFKQTLPTLAAEIEKIPIKEEKHDEIIWDHGSNGVLTVKDAYDHYRKKLPTRQWMKGLWENNIPPKISIFMWKVANNRVETAVNLKRRNV